LLEQHETDLANLKQRIDNLLIENYRLRDQSVAEGGSVILLPKLLPILQHRGVESVSTEIREIWNSKKSVAAPPPTTLISLADLQKYFIQFTDSHLCSLSPHCWTLHTTNKKFLGREMPTEGTKSSLSGIFGGVNAAELMSMNCEILVSSPVSFFFDFL
jgi:hypothetical protein